MHFMMPSVCIYFGVWCIYFQNLLHLCIWYNVVITCVLPLWRILVLMMKLLFIWFKLVPNFSLSFLLFVQGNSWKLCWYCVREQWWGKSFLPFFLKRKPWFSHQVPKPLCSLSLSYWWAKRLLHWCERRSCIYSSFTMCSGRHLWCRWCICIWYFIRYITRHFRLKRNGCVSSENCSHSCRATGNTT